MRHATLGLTSSVDTNPKRLDVYGTLAALPAFPLTTDPCTERIAVKATVIGPNPRSWVAPTVAPDGGNRC